MKNKKFYLIGGIIGVVALFMGFIVGYDYGVTSYRELCESRLDYQEDLLNSACSNRLFSSEAQHSAKLKLCYLEVNECNLKLMRYATKGMINESNFTIYDV